MERGGGSAFISSLRDDWLEESGLNLRRGNCGSDHLAVRATAPAGRQRYGRIIATADRRRRFVLPAMKGARQAAPLQNLGDESHG